MSPLRIALVEDHALVRAGLRTLLEQTPELTVVAECDNGREAVDVVVRANPDLVLLDVTLPGINGLEVAERLARQAPHTKIIMVSMHADPLLARRAFRAGATGYVVKGVEFGELEQAIVAVSAGRPFVSSGLAGSLQADPDLSAPPHSAGPPARETGAGVRAEPGPFRRLRR